MARKDHSIVAFISQFAKGGARTNRFRVELTFPTMMNVDGTLGNFVSMACKAAALPESNVGQIMNVDYQGRKVKMPGDREYPDWTCTFYEDDEHRIRDTLTIWSDIMNGHMSNVSSGSGDVIDFFGSAKVIQLNNRDGNDEDGRSVIIQSIFPTLIGEIAYDWSDTNTVVTFPCTFAINWIEIEGVTT